MFWNSNNVYLRFSFNNVHLLEQEKCAFLFDYLNMIKY